MSSLARIWQLQKEYNIKIRDMEEPRNKEYWSEKYLLGIVSEIDEVLQEINWKIHRRGRTTNRNNLARELADVTKYVFSLWELHGFNYIQMLEYVEQKTNELNRMYEQDFEKRIPPGSKVLITDIDGTIGDWRKAFVGWMREQGLTTEIDNSTSMQIEIDLGISYTEYAALKERFESEGGYKLLEAYDGVKEMFTKIVDQGWKIIAYTARPHNRYSRIWYDTWEWLKFQELENLVSELHIGSEERVLTACFLREEGCKVVLLDDDPTLALRAANTGLPVMLRDQRYNKGIEHLNIYRFNNIELCWDVHHKDFTNEQT